MNILIAPDKFKGSLTASEVCQVISEEILSIDNNHKIVSLPLADGGEGTAEILTELSEGETITLSVLDPIFRPIEATYGLSKDGTTAFIEMAKASGLQLLAPSERNCMKTSTYGTGELIQNALHHGTRKIIMGIGGSATNDAGMGMARALGINFYDDSKNLLEGRGEDLIKLARVDFENRDPLILDTEFIVLTDVTNPLHGINGAAHVYARQKGASDADITVLDEGLINFEKIARQMECPINFPGAGAAGGLGAGAKFFLNASIRRGMDFIAEFTQLESKIKSADLVITGEGKLDSQSLSGKVVNGVVDLAKKHGKEVVVIAGICELSPSDLKNAGITKVISLSDENTPPHFAMSNSRALLRERVRKSGFIG